METPRTEAGASTERVIALIHQLIPTIKTAQHNPIWSHLLDEFTKFEARATRAEAEVKELREHHQRDEALLVQRTDDLRALRDTVTALRADRERLDYLDQHSSICFDHHTPEHPFPVGKLREAVDASIAAMNAKPV